MNPATFATPRMTHRTPNGMLWRRSIAGWVPILPYASAFYCVARRHGRGWALLGRHGVGLLSFAHSLNAAAEWLRRQEPQP